MKTFMYISIGILIFCSLFILVAMYLLIWNYVLSDEIMGTVCLTWCLSLIGSGVFAGQIKDLNKLK